MALTLEKVFPVAFLDLTATVTMVASAPAGGVVVDNPQVLRVDQATDLTFDWTPSGLLWFQFSDVKFDAFYELMGPGEAVIGAPTSITVPIGAFGVPQTTTLTIPGNNVPAGVYRIVLRMGVTPTGFPQPTAICGFEELGLIEYYTPV